LARAQANAELIPPSAAQSIVGTCKEELFDVPKLVRESVHTRCMAMPLVRSLCETVGLFNKEAAGFVNYGCSSQDVTDSAMALVTRDALDLIEADLGQSITLLLALAASHAGDPMLARNQLQPASITSFGLKCTQWAAPLVRCQQRLASLVENALNLQLGGAVGTQSEMKGKGPQVMALMAAELKLKAPTFAWHAQRDEWLALGCELGLLVGSVGKIAKDLSLLAQFEVGEIDTDESACMVALTAAHRVPQRVAALLAAMPQEHERGLGNWQSGLAEWPALLMSTHGAVRAMVQALSALRVDNQRMHTNLDAQRATLSAKDAAERFGAKLAEHAGALARTQIKALAVLNKPETSD
jgi:3-carboxy-cis,cis-muconate cycloisomerase